MRLTIALAALLLFSPPRVRAQEAPQARLTVRVSASGLPLEHAVVRSGAAAAPTNAAGVARLALPAGPASVTITLLGYAPDTLRLTLAAGRDTSVAVELREVAAQLSGIVVTSARGAQRIEEEPTRVEVLAGDDVAEKTEMRPADLKGFLSEMAGVRVQQTSAATGASAVRLQGLRPRYTLLLADGLPLYGGGGGGGLDLLQLPPADLRQIEVVKGPASALYGPAALGGMINLVSKRPGHEGDLLVQATDQQGANAFAWTSRRRTDAFGYTGVAGAHAQRARDADGDGWVDLPEVRRVEARPRAFYESRAGSSLFVTAGGTLEEREGGFLAAHLAPDGEPYAERVETRRGDVGAVAHRLVGERALLQLRGAANVDGRARRFGDEPEHVTRSTGFGELSLANTMGAHDLLGGVAVQGEGARVREYRPLDYTFATWSGFAQDAWRLAPMLALTASARLDGHSRYGAHLSPRLSLLAGPAKGWSARLSATHGASAPTPFIEETDAVGARRVRGFDALDAELADYGAFDLTGVLGPVELNGTLYASRVRRQVVAGECRELADCGLAEAGTLQLGNARTAARAHGAELFAVYELEPLFVTALYSFTDSREPEDALATRAAPAAYVPRHAGGLDVTWEDEERGTWIAVEAFYSGRQPLRDDPYRTTGAPYTVVGILATQRVGRFKLFANVENVGDVRQTDWAPLVLPARTLSGRWTVDAWAPLEGRVYSIGLRVSSGDLVPRHEE